ncbi:MAG: xanthine dehydrogenase family protein subunit M [Gammaproteobacteria bacterium]|nr:xanthine dehydrogenase family protein subunit M [Gammaproteobacteria bacterium]
MHTFEYARPDNLSEALSLLNEHGSQARVLAGGTDLIVGMRSGKLSARIVIDLKRVAELRPGITEHDGALRIGAAVVLTDVIDDERVKDAFPALVEAASVVGSVQIRNRATLAGNICNASPAADTVPALMIYNAVVNTVSGSGERRVPLVEFFVGPGQTVLRPDEIVTSIDLPFPERPIGAAFERIARRRGMDLATVNVACSVTGDGVTRFAYGAVGPTAFVVDDRSGRLADPAVGEEDKERLLKDLAAQASPISDVRASREYRQAMLTVLGKRTLATALGRLRRVL